MRTNSKMLTLAWSKRNIILNSTNVIFFLSFPDHILEHSEDDTKSLFVIIKVPSHSQQHKISLLFIREMSLFGSGPWQFIVCLSLTADRQWPHVFPRHSQDGVWLTLEKIHSCQEVHGKQGELGKCAVLLIVRFNQSSDIWICCFFFFLLQLCGKKQHIRALLIDRVLLQHEVSVKKKNTPLTWCGENFLEFLTCELMTSNTNDSYFSIHLQKK